MELNIKYKSAVETAGPSLSKSESGISLDSVTMACKEIDQTERTKRLSDLKAKSLATLAAANKKKVIAIKPKKIE